MSSRPFHHVGSFLALVLCGFASAQDLPTEPVVCEYPRPKVREPFPSLNPALLGTAGEIEPNNAAGASQVIPLGMGVGLHQDVDISGRIDAPFDKDWFRFEAVGGDTIGVAVLAVDANSLDSLVALRDATGAVLLQNDQHGGMASFYPPQSPFPAGGIPGDSALTYTIPQSGTYFIQVEGRGAVVGGYLAQIRLRKPPLLGRPIGSKQIIFLDFDGATGVHADELFGSGGIHNASLSQLDDFLPNWGIPASRRDALIDGIVANVRARFEQVLTGTGSQVEIRNSKDHPDSFGKPNVSRVIVGGKISQLGISTIGIAEHVDPGNFSTTDTAVVLLDLLSSPALNPNSVLSLPRAPGHSVEDAVAHVVSCVVVHEACHFLGCWHVENSNSTRSLIDKGGDLRNSAGIGGDGILGTADDVLPLVLDDKYASEGVGRTQDTENVRPQVIAALSVGTALVADEAAAIREAITGIENARQRPLLSGVRNRFSPAYTRRLLGLPAIEGDAEEQAHIEHPNDRYNLILTSLKSRLHPGQKTLSEYERLISTQVEHDLPNRRFAQDEYRDSGLETEYINIGFTRIRIDKKWDLMIRFQEPRAKSELKLDVTNFDTLSDGSRIMTLRASYPYRGEARGRLESFTQEVGFDGISQIELKTRIRRRAEDATDYVVENIPTTEMSSMSLLHFTKISELDEKARVLIKRAVEEQNVRFKEKITAAVATVISNG